MNDTTRMTEQDLKDANPLADKFLEQIKDVRPPTAVAALCFALAAVTHLARCGPNAAIVLFKSYYARLEAAGARQISEG